MKITFRAGTVNYNRLIVWHFEGGLVLGRTLTSGTWRCVVLLIRNVVNSVRDQTASHTRRKYISKISLYVKEVRDGASPYVSCYSLFCCKISWKMLVILNTPAFRLRYIVMDNWIE